MQHGREHRPFDGKRERPVLEQAIDHRLDANGFPETPEQQRRADPQCGEADEFAFVEGRQDHGMLCIAADRVDEALEVAIFQHLLFAAEVLDDALLGAAIFAHALDQVEIGVAVDGFFADIHESLAALIALKCQA